MFLFCHCAYATGHACLHVKEVLIRGEPMLRPYQMSAACVCPAELYVSTQSTFHVMTSLGVVQLPHEWSSYPEVALHGFVCGYTQQSCVLVMLLWRTALPSGGCGAGFCFSVFSDICFLSIPSSELYFAHTFFALVPLSFLQAII